MREQRGESSARPVPGPMDALEVRRYVLETSPRRVRVLFGGEVVVDSTRVQLPFETGKLPVYYFPRCDVRSDSISDSGRESSDAVKGRTAYFDVKAGGCVASDGAWTCTGNPDVGPGIDDLIAFDWNKMDAWFEEDEEVFVHARDPYHRVDVVESSRHVVVNLDGVKVADSHRPMILFETGLPTRYYLPKMDIRFALPERSDTHTSCPYKGTADYFGVRTGERLIEDVAWCYENPIPEMPKIAGRICFYNEKVELEIDGELQERPRTKWS